nr:sensor histidine kinase [Mangrovactinospora gilvigrisea]
MAQDAVIAVLSAAVGLRFVEMGSAGGGGDSRAVGVLLLAQSVALVLRRRFPQSVFAVTLAAMIGGTAAALPAVALMIAPAVAYGTAVARLGRRKGVLAGALLWAAVVFAAARHGSHGVPDAALLGLLGIALLGWAADGRRLLLRQRASAEVQLVRLEEGQRERERQAVLLERVRIARELHDVTAHHLSVIAVQSSMARYVLSTERETAEQALLSISEVSSEGLAELRRLITLLRPDEERESGHREDRPAPGIEQLPVLIERIGLSGVPVLYTVTGAQQRLTAGLELCVYRVAQEALTNVLKHAPGASVDIVLHYGTEELRLHVLDDGRKPSGSTHPVELPSGGKGLTGMRERTALYGGSVSTGPVPGGGFSVDLRLPFASGKDR